MNTDVTESADKGKHPAKKKDSPRKLLTRLGIIISAGYLLIVGTLVLNEQNIVYPGSKFPNGLWEPTNFNYEEVVFKSADETVLVGWYLKKPIMLPASSPDRTVLICHGNAVNVAESAGYTGEYFRHALGADVFAFDYRGFGKSEGSPNERGVLADSEAAMQWICEKSGKTPDQIFVVGDSLGGGPAVHLASTCGCKALILQRTFSSMPDAAQSRYPWIPVRYVMRNQYRSCDKIKNCNQPLHQSHSTDDQLVPVASALKLFNSSPAKHKKFFEVKELGHNDPFPLVYWYDMALFINEIDAATDEQIRATGRPGEDL